MNDPSTVIRKSYADTSIGQVHCRAIGQGRDLVLIHWTPFSSRIYRHVMPLLAQLGYRVTALDLPGYGRSDPRPSDFSMEQYGPVLAEALESLGITKAKVLGGHMGAAAALELALAGPHVVEQLVIDGLPFLTAELKSVLSQMIATPRPSMDDDEDLPSLAWRRAVGVYEEYIPGFEVNDRNVDQVWEAMIDYLHTDFVSSAPLLARYDAPARLKMLRTPLAILGADSDSLYDAFKTAIKLKPEAASFLINGEHPLHFPERAPEYCDILASVLCEPN